MRMQTRFLIIMMVYIFGGFFVIVGSQFSDAAVFAWFVLFVVIQFIIFRCPHCRRFVLMNNPDSHKNCPHCFEDF
jgi:hypothetical protein